MYGGLVLAEAVNVWWLVLLALYEAVNVWWLSIAGIVV